MKQNVNIEDEKIKSLLLGTKISASDNLKYRIMQQIESEKALARKNVKVPQRESVLGNFFSIYGVVYAIIAVFAAGLYFTSGKDSLMSSSFFGVAILVVVVGSAFLAITMIDNRRFLKKKE